MKTKRMILSIFSLLLVSSLFAQTPQEAKEKTPEERAKKQTEMMKDKLVLSDKQVAEVEKINLKYALQADVQHKEMMAKREALRAQKEAELQKVLRPEQIAKLQDMKKKQEEKKANRMEKMQNRKECKKNNP